jgi:hypothetical protein
MTNNNISFYCEHKLVRVDCVACGGVEKSAILSGDRKYRYVLRRRWDLAKPNVMFIGLNPSTADENEDDPTIRRCIAFAKSWGFGGLVMVNLFAWRSTMPLGLWDTPDPIGPDNAIHLIDGKYSSSLHIAAWGDGKLVNKLDPERVAAVRALLDDLYYLKLNKDGTPGHPLYLKGNLLPQLWSR